MKTEIIEPASNAIPQVGQPWRSEGSDCICVRIDDTDGARALGMPKEGLFFSIRLEAGDVVWTGVKADNIQLLKPIGVTPDGTIQFAPL